MIAPSEQADVLVIGAGPVGLLLAAELLRHGADRVRVVDKTAGTKSISKALIQHVRTQEIMDAIGTIADVQGQSVPLRRVEVHAYGRYAGQWRLDEVDSPYPSPVILGQDRTERILETHLNQLGGRVEWNTEAVAAEQDTDAVRVTLRRPGGEHAVRAYYVVGCEGSDSLVRKAAGFTFEGERYTGEQFIQADAKIRWSYPRGESHLFLTVDGEKARHGYLMVIEMPDDFVRVFVSLPEDAPPRHDNPTLEEVQSALRHLGAPDATLSDSVWLARYRTSHRTADRFRNGRLFVAGDAGHVHVPIGGQGMNTGLQDAFNLGWKLAAVCAGRAPDALLDTYQAERHPVAKALIAGTDRAYRFVLHPGELAKTAAKHLAPFVLGLDAVQDRFRTTLEEVGIGYRGGPLSEDHGGRAGVQAGDRAPDATSVDAATLETVRLFDIMRHPGWTLFAFAGPNGREAEVSALAERAERVATAHGAMVRCALLTDGLNAREFNRVRVLLDRIGHAHEAYGVTGPALVLVRPDWYVGFRGRASDGDALLNYLGRWLASRAAA